MSEIHNQAMPNAPFSPAELTVLAHLYRGEVYRSTVWRTRLDATTNWAVVATGLALSLTFSSSAASPLPLALVGLLVAVFLCIEARRYRFFDFWRIRAHILEVNFFGPILRRQGPRVDNGWNEILYHDYAAPNLHITFFEAAGRRLRRNYGWIFLIQVTCYAGKLLIHPVPIASLDDVWQRAAITRSRMASLRFGSAREFSREAPNLGNLIERVFDCIRERALDPATAAAYMPALEEAQPSALFRSGRAHHALRTQRGSGSRSATAVGRRRSGTWQRDRPRNQTRCVRLSES
jgi:uncharacterized membrane protein